MRILNIAVGVIYILASVWCFLNAGRTFAALAFVLGILMLLHGAVGLLTYVKINNKSAYHGYLLTESVTAALLAVVVISNRLIADNMIPGFFGVWLLFVGVGRVVSSIHSERGGEKHWLWKAGLGLAAALAGMYIFFNSSLMGFSVAIVTGIAFMAQGANILFTGIIMPKAAGKAAKNNEAEKQVQ